MDVNLIHIYIYIYKKTFLKCTSVCAIFLPVCFTLLDYRRKRLMFSLTLGPQLAADALQQAQTE